MEYLYIIAVHIFDLKNLSLSDASSVKYIIPISTGKLSSKTGSLARKRELREMLEQQDEGYEDDAFEGTPFRSKKVSKVMQVSYASKVA